MEGKLRSLQCSFLWGGDENARKIPWIRWKEVCRSKKGDGLGIKNMHLFNSTLFCEWVWWFFTESGSARVIRSRHGSPTWMMGSIYDDCGRSKTRWWRKIVSVVEGREYGWFWEKMAHKLGDGREAPLWEGVWSGDKSLRIISEIISPKR